MPFATDDFAYEVTPAMHLEWLREIANNTGMIDPVPRCYWLRSALVLDTWTDRARIYRVAKMPAPSVLVAPTEVIQVTFRGIWKTVRFQRHKEEALSGSILGLFWNFPDKQQHSVMVYDAIAMMREMAQAELFPEAATA